MLYNDWIKDSAMNYKKCKIRIDVLVELRYSNGQLLSVTEM